jgi:VanZ family protein
METHLSHDSLNRTPTNGAFNKRRPYGALIIHWLPVVTWVGLIFFFSTEQFSSDNTSKMLGSLLGSLFGISAGAIDVINLVIRKLGHWSEYAVLAVLLLWALKNDAGKVWEWRHACWTLLFILLCATSDELHQAFVPSRTASAGDTMIDVFGGICGSLWTYWYRKGIAVPLNGRANTTTT